jgi:hypothetical protein
MQMRGRDGKAVGAPDSNEAVLGVLACTVSAAVIVWRFLFFKYLVRCSSIQSDKTQIQIRALLSLLLLDLPKTYDGLARRSKSK